MTDWVVDSSIAVKWFVEEEHTEEALRIFDDLLSGAKILWAPDLLISEFTNVMWKRVLAGDIDEAFAVQSVRDLLQIDLKIVESRELVSSALELAVQFRRTVYDSLYLALSLRLECPIITADRRLYKAVHPEFPGIRWVGAL
ncbi:MAG: type II toxin-antitoxin system VapC family toxin [candidate division NC10 bacterium]|nr:type II toxin-antitoxin system VapC family toxin [candidate division NC10 bacterium]